MKWATLTALLLLCFSTFAQDAHLQVLKNGRVKKRIPQNSLIKLTSYSGDTYIGEYRIINDTLLYISQVQVKLSDMRSVKIIHPKRRANFTWAQFGYSTLGAALAATGMSLAKWEPTPRAIAYSAVLGYSPYALGLLRTISLKKYRFHRNRKFNLRIWSIERYDLPRRELAPF